ncbi:MAG TPA: hypothetical protein VJN88_07740 [Ktedonobacterales bacterium]|nr:hypothetical protein [Ktedonobacterales bacterium]
MSNIVEELASLVAQLPEREQERVLNFARELAHPPVFPHTPLPGPGTPGHVVAQLRVSDEVGEAMERALSPARKLASSPLPLGGMPDTLLRLQIDDATGEAMARAHEECERPWSDEQHRSDD